MIPLVSVIIPTYNASKYVCDAVESALAQTFEKIEIIVVDDGSNDGTAELLNQNYGDQITYIYKENGGPASARNLGIKQSHGEIIAFLDADDLWKPDKLEQQLASFGEISLLIGSGEKTKNDGSVEKITFEKLVLKNRFTNSGVVVRRSAFVEIGLFNERQEFIAVEDWDMWIRLSKTGEVVLLHRDLITIRLTDESISAPSQADKMLSNERVVLRKHLAGRPILYARALSARYFSAAWAFNECCERSKALLCILLSLWVFPMNFFNRQHVGLFVKIILCKE